MISVSMTVVWHFVKLGGGLKLGNGEALGSSGLTVHKSVNACLTSSDTCESEIRLSSSFSSGGLLI